MSVIIDNLILSSISEIRNNTEIYNNTKLHINASQELDKLLHLFGLVEIKLNWFDVPLQDINENGILFHLIKMIDGYISCGKQVLINCFAGVSRSATIVIAYLMYKNKWSVQDAIYFVRSKRGCINPNYGFICQLYNLQHMLHTLDDNFEKYCYNFENKTSIQLANEVSIISKISIVEKICKRELNGFDMPT